MQREEFMVEVININNIQGMYEVMAEVKVSVLQIKEIFEIVKSCKGKNTKAMVGIKLGKVYKQKRRKISMSHNLCSQ